MFGVVVFVREGCVVCLIFEGEVLFGYVRCILMLNEEVVSLFVLFFVEG